MVSRPDLADRAIFISLEAIRERERRTEHDLWNAFREERPKILGALLDAVASGLAALPGKRLARLPRMADFAHWVAACEGALWANGTFEAAYRQSHARAVDEIVEADPIAHAVRDLVKSHGGWKGTASQLLAVLAQSSGNATAWPDTPRGLAGRLRRAATFLREIGVEVAFMKEGALHTRMIVLGLTRNSCRK